MSRGGGDGVGGVDLKTRPTLEMWMEVSKGSGEGQLLLSWSA